MVVALGRPVLGVHGDGLRFVDGAPAATALAKGEVDVLVVRRVVGEVESNPPTSSKALRRTSMAALRT